MLPGKEESVAERTTIAVDLAKSVFEIAVSSRPGRVTERHRLSRSQLPPPQHVRRYRPRNKTDRADAKALLESAGTPLRGLSS
jgi:transposase